MSEVAEQQAKQSPSLPHGYAKSPVRTPQETLDKTLNTLLNVSGYFSEMRAKELERVRKRQAAYEKQSAIERCLKGCNVWDKYRNASLGDESLPKAMLTDAQFARFKDVIENLKSLEAEPGLVVLHGANGPGKTYLASALVIDFCRKGLPAYFVTAVDFFTSIKSTFGEKGRTLEDVVRRFRSYELLVIDEIENRSESNWENVLLRDLINARYSSLLSTVMITNKTRDELTGGMANTPYFNTAILDRMKDNGAMLHCDWPSLRGSEPWQDR